MRSLERLKHVVDEVTAVSEHLVATDMRSLERLKQLRLIVLVEGAYVATDMRSLERLKQVDQRREHHF